MLVVTDVEEAFSILRSRGSRSAMLAAQGRLSQQLPELKTLSANAVRYAQQLG